jgi:phage FluMu protein Com
MTKGKKVKLRALKGSGYKCPVCKKGNLIEIKTEKALGNVDIKFKTIDGISFQFSCDVRGPIGGKGTKHRDRPARSSTARVHWTPTRTYQLLRSIQRKDQKILF